MKVSELTVDQYNTLYYYITATYYVNAFMFVTSGIRPNVCTDKSSFITEITVQCCTNRIFVVECVAPL